MEWTSRKWILALLAQAQFAYAFFYTDKLSAIYWIVAVLATFLGYGVLNVLYTLWNVPKQDQKPLAEPKE